MGSVSVTDGPVGPLPCLDDVPSSKSRSEADDSMMNASVSSSQRTCRATPAASLRRKRRLAISCQLSGGGTDQRKAKLTVSPDPTATSLGSTLNAPTVPNTPVPAPLNDCHLPQRSNAVKKAVAGCPAPTCWMVKRSEGCGGSIGRFTRLVPPSCAGTPGWAGTVIFALPV